MPCRLRPPREVTVELARGGGTRRLRRGRRSRLEGWTRDVTVVRVEGDAVVGSSETAKALRDRYRLAARQFSVVLIGKDGHVALRSATALSSAQLEAAIDAMPMRKSGLR